MRVRLVLALISGVITTLAADGSSPPRSEGNWKQILEQRIPLYGHRNWIVIADSAYPAQSREGIETIVSGEDHIAVLKQVLTSLSASKHVRPIVYTDKELNFVDEKDAPGISGYREQLAAILQKRQVNVLTHEQIISKLDEISQTFRVLIIKTNLTLPYTSVFLQLDAGYWSADAERRLRAKMAGTSEK